jgi:hypothetical protein
MGNTDGWVGSVITSISNGKSRGMKSVDHVHYDASLAIVEGGINEMGGR